MQKLFFKSLLALFGVSNFTFVPQVALSQARIITHKVTSAEATPLISLVPSNVAVILNSGSTNTIGYRIFVAPSGQASYIDGYNRANGKISAALTKKFFSDIQAALPLEKLPTRRCVKSVSFGTFTTIRLGGEQSPDISCPGNAKVQSLFKDVTEIAQALNVSDVPRSQGNELPPLNF